MVVGHSKFDCDLGALPLANEYNSEDCWSLAHLAQMGSHHGTTVEYDRSLLSELHPSKRAAPLTADEAGAVGEAADREAGEAADREAGEAADREADDAADHEAGEADVTPGPNEPDVAVAPVTARVLLLTQTNYA